MTSIRSLTPERQSELLSATSRTFAPAISLLSEPTRGVVGLSYLLFRIADTLEDAAAWPKVARIRALDELVRLLDANEPAAWREASQRWLADDPTRHEGYRALLEGTPAVIEAMFGLPAGTRDIVRSHVRRTALGMQEVLERASDDGTVELGTIDELRRYCYIVAGIVGELLTAVFLEHAPQLRAVAPVLVENQAAFGEGLQLVNILKDAGDDARENRSFLPKGVSRAEVIALARRDLDRADAYNAALAKGGAPAGFSAFTGLPAELARKNLDLLERHGAGAKVPRDEVVQIFQRYLADASSASAQTGK